jgi:Peptidase propeptide and YPEB domain
MNRLLFAAVISAALAPAAFAQGNNQSTNDGSSASMPLPQQIKQKLQSAGYTEVTVMPRSFFVQAKDRQGDPVEIVITPRSMTQVTALNTSEQGNMAGTQPSGMQPGGMQPGGMQRGGMQPSGGQ